MLRGQIQPLAININGYHCRPARCRDLHSESPDAAHAGEYSHVVRTKLRPADGLVRGRDRIRHNGERRQRNSVGQLLRYRTEPTTGNDHVRGKTAVAIVARHELLAANGCAPRFAGRTLATGNHGRDDYGLPLPTGDSLPRRDHATNDFMSQH